MLCNITKAKKGANSNRSHMSIQMTQMGTSKTKRSQSGVVGNDPGCQLVTRYSQSEQTVN